MLQRSVNLNNRAKVHKQYGNRCYWSCCLTGNVHTGFHLARMTLMFSEIRHFRLSPDVSWQHPGRNQASPPAKDSPKGLKITSGSSLITSPRRHFTLSQLWQENKSFLCLKNSSV